MPIRDTLRRLLRGAAPSKPAAPPIYTNPPPPERNISPIKSNPPSPHTDASSGLGKQRELALYKYDSCPFCRRVQRTIQQLGVADKIEMRDTRREPKWRTDLIDKTGRTQVPCLFIDGEPMFESADISRWLTEQYG